MPNTTKKPRQWIVLYDGKVQVKGWNDPWLLYDPVLRTPWSDMRSASRGAPLALYPTLALARAAIYEDANARVRGPEWFHRSGVYQLAPVTLP